ncbi:MAG: helix-hairpin-helix domain-containing protein [Myxococcota bacterium]|jgi:competence protein ComEC|nr:helix-hairpin-helix domain-containing protein [Myxococcota bacterium]
MMRRGLGLGLFLWLLGLAAIAGAEELKLELLDVGQGDSILISVGEKHVLIDAGEKKADVVGLLQQRKLKKLDLVVATHAHADHIGGMENVVRNFEVGLFTDNGIPHTSATYEKLMTTVEELGIKYKTAKKGQSYKLGDAKLEVLFPDGEPLTGTRSDINSNSVILRLTHGQNCFLLTGDAEEPTEVALLADELGACSVLKVAHHGGNHSSNEPFLDAVAPKIALISVGTNNRYSHPGEETLERLHARKVDVYRTDLSGTLEVISDGKSVEILETGSKNTAAKGSPQDDPEEESASGAKININTASSSELQKLPGIGKKKADDIVAYREANGPFSSVDELSKVKGISAKTVDKFRAQVTLEGGSAASADSKKVPTTPAASGAGIDINTASVSELQKLKGIGKKKAEDIVAEREANGPFASCQELSRVKGIGAKSVEKLLEQCTVSGGSAAQNTKVESEVKATTPSSGGAEGKIDINTASLSELQKLKGIGKKKAEDIIAERESGGPFASCQELTRVKGIGAKSVEKLLEQCTVGAVDSPAKVVPKDNEEASPAPSSSAGRININTASASELQKLPGIGKKKAADIVAERESGGAFASCQELTRVKGIGAKSVEKLLEQCTTE